MEKADLDDRLRTVKDFIQIGDEKKLFLPADNFLTRKWVHMWQDRDKDFLSRVGLTQLKWKYSPHVYDSYAKNNKQLTCTR